MKAIVCPNCSSTDVLSLEEIAKPVPDDRKVLLRVCAGSANPMDGFAVMVARVQRRLAWLRKPTMTRLGTDVSGGSRSGRQT